MGLWKSFKIAKGAFGFLPQLGMPVVGSLQITEEEMRKQQGAQWEGMAVSE